MYFYKNNKVHLISQKMVYRFAKEIELEDVFENMGAQLVKEVDPKRQMRPVMEQQRATVLAQEIQEEDLRQ